MAQPKRVEFVVGARDATRRVFRRIRGGLRRLSGAVLSFRGLVAGVFAGAAIRGLAKFAEGLEAVNDNAASLGLTTDQLQALQFAARETGLSGNDVITVFQRLNRRIGEARDGSALMIQSFEALGITFDDLNNLTTPEVFDKIIEQARLLPRVIADARIGKVLDVEGLRLARLFREEFESIADAVQRAGAQGAIRTPAELQTAEEFAESLREFGRVFGAEVIPGMLEFGKILTENTPTIIEGFKNLTEALKTFVKVVLAIPAFGARLGEAAFEATQGFRGGGRGEGTAGGRLVGGVLDVALRNLQEIRDISARAERRDQRGDVTGVYGA